jgi:hypothetical protein
MKLRLTTLALLFVISACSGGGTSMQTLPANQQPTPVKSLRANVNFFGFGTSQTTSVQAPQHGLPIQVVIGSGLVCNSLLILNGVTNSDGCDAVVFIPNGQTFTSLPGFLYTNPLALTNGVNYSLDLYQGVATCVGLVCNVGGPFTLIHTNIGQAGGFTASSFTVKCNTVATCGANGFPFTAQPVLAPPLNVGYLVNLRPS